MLKQYFEVGTQKAETIIDGFFKLQIFEKRTKQLNFTNNHNYYKKHRNLLIYQFILGN